MRKVVPNPNVYNTINNEHGNIQKTKQNPCAEQYNSIPGCVNNHFEERTNIFFHKFMFSVLPKERTLT
jgi:hypothetical protein